MAITITKPAADDFARRIKLMARDAPFASSATVVGIIPATDPPVACRTAAVVVAYFQLSGTNIRPPPDARAVSKAATAGPTPRRESRPRIVLARGSALTESCAQDSPVVSRPAHRLILPDDRVRSATEIAGESAEFLIKLGPAFRLIVIRDGGVPARQGTFRTPTFTQSPPSGFKSRPRRHPHGDTGNQLASDSVRRIPCVCAPAPGRPLARCPRHRVDRRRLANKAAEHCPVPFNERGEGGLASSARPLRNLSSKQLSLSPTAVPVWNKASICFATNEDVSLAKAQCVPASCPLFDIIREIVSATAELRLQFFSAVSPRHGR